MTKVNKKIHPLQEAVDLVNRTRAINLKIASRIKGKALNIHNKLAHRGGIKAVIQSLNDACLELESITDKGEGEIRSLETLRQLRDMLIQEHYGWKTWNLVERMLA